MKSVKIINDVNNVSFELLQDQMTELEGWEYSSVRDVVEDISGPQSAFYVTSKQGRRRMSITGYVRGLGLEGRRDLLSAIKQTGKMKLLQFTTLDDLELQTLVEVLSLQFPYNKLEKPFLLEFVAPDWRFYSQELKLAEVAVNSSDGVENMGNEITQPTFKIYGPLTEATITNLNSTESVQITYNLNDGDYIEIDTLARTVTLNGGVSVFSSFEGDFISLIAGENTLSFSATGSGGNTKLDVEYRDAYNGI